MSAPAPLDDGDSTESEDEDDHFYLLRPVDRSDSNSLGARLENVKALSREQHHRMTLLMAKRTRSRSLSPTRSPSTSKGDGSADEEPERPQTPPPGHSSRLAQQQHGSYDDGARMSPVPVSYTDSDPDVLARSSPTSGSGGEEGSVPGAPAKSKTENVTVVCRFRPLNMRERNKEGDALSVVINESNTSVKLLAPEKGMGGKKADEDQDGSREFTFSHVFRPGVNQHSVYESVGRPLVDSVMEGYNAAVICYGQTGSGKTFTMIGDEKDPTNPDLHGVIPRLSNDLFQRIRLRGQGQVEDTVRCSYIEIYMEKVRDLLKPAIGIEHQDLMLREDRERGLWIAGVTEVPVTSYADVKSILERGNSARVTAATASNPLSSRSHAIFIMAIHTLDRRAMLTKTSQLYAVDLAGSENVRKSEAEGQLLDEAKKINTSLLALGQVIYALTQGKRRGIHIPYRDSKLTRILQNTFGGNSRTCMVVNASPSVYNHRETLSALRFGDRSQHIRNKPSANIRRSVAELEKLLEVAGSELKTTQQTVAGLGKKIAIVTLQRDKALSEVDDLRRRVSQLADVADRTESDDGDGTESEDEAALMKRINAHASDDDDEEETSESAMALKMVLGKAWILSKVPKSRGGLKPLPLGSMITFSQSDSTYYYLGEDETKTAKGLLTCDSPTWGDGSARKADVQFALLQSGEASGPPSKKVAPKKSGEEDGGGGGADDASTLLRLVITWTQRNDGIALAAPGVVGANLTEDGKLCLAGALSSEFSTGKYVFEPLGTTLVAALAAERSSNRRRISEMAAKVKEAKAHPQAGGGGRGGSSHEAGGSGHGKAAKGGGLFGCCAAAPKRRPKGKH